MTDLTDALAQLRSSRNEVPAAILTADLDRGRAALRHRRVRRAGGAAAVGVIAAAVSGYVATSHHNGPHVNHASSVPTGPAKADPVAPKLRVRLVAYDGQEPAGFRVAQIPQGYDLHVQSSNRATFIVAPANDADTDPDVFVGKLVVSAESSTEMAGWRSYGDGAVTINGADGRIGDDGSATQIWWEDHGVVIDAQCWDRLGLTHAQLVDFANGVTTTDALQLSHG